MSSFWILLTLFSASAAFNCYTHTTYNDDPPNSDSKTIPCSTMCYKSTTIGSGDDKTTYGCDTKVASYCNDISGGECASSEIGVVTASVCCCTGELCNSSDTLQPLLGILLLIFNRLL